MDLNAMIWNVQLDEDAIKPNQAHDWDGGFDLYSREDKIILNDSSEIFNTGVHIQIPQGYVGFLKSKSGLNVKYGITGEGVIDAGYTGPIVVKLYNNGPSPYKVNKGDKISQIVFLPIPSVVLAECESIETNTERGNNGFGSSGK